MNLTVLSLFLLTLLTLHPQTSSALPTGQPVHLQKRFVPLVARLATMLGKKFGAKLFRKGALKYGPRVNSAVMKRAGKGRFGSSIVQKVGGEVDRSLAKSALSPLTQAAKKKSVINKYVLPAVGMTTLGGVAAAGVEDELSKDVKKEKKERDLQGDLQGQNAEAYTLDLDQDREDSEQSEDEQFEMQQQNDGFPQEEEDEDWYDGDEGVNDQERIEAEMDADALQQEDDDAYWPPARKYSSYDFDREAMKAF